MNWPVAVVNLYVLAMFAACLRWTWRSRETAAIAIGWTVEAALMALVFYALYAGGFYRDIHFL